MKKIYPYIILVIIIFSFVFLGVRFLSGEEDTWLCVEGEWVKHGNPAKEKPLSGCGLINSNSKNINVANVDNDVVENTNTAPSDKEACVAKSGIWGLVGLSEEEVCNLPAGDGGKDCYDGNSCETKICLVELDEDENERYNRGEIIAKTGKCPQWQIVTGCYLLVDGGMVTTSICFD